jgi:threonine dehydrogenase-like Zn-dependent dehydrogenase
MRAAIFNGPRAVTAGELPDPAINEPTDAIVRVVLACVCGSDLWYYRGQTPHEPGGIGHEFIGIVEQVGSDVHLISSGDFVIAPFAFSDGTYPNCRAGIQTACLHGGFFGGDGLGGRAERARVPLADGTLVKIPDGNHSDETLRSLLALPT